MQLGVIAALLQDRPALQLWLDAGFVDLAGLHSTLAALGRLAARVTPVLASESWCSLDELRAACRVRLDARPSNPARWKSRWLFEVSPRHHSARPIRASRAGITPSL